MRLKRLENNTGTITKLSGTRTRPYIIQSPYLLIDGQLKRKILGYSKTYIDALKILQNFKNSTTEDSVQYLSNIYIDTLTVGEDRKKFIIRINNIFLKSFGQYKIQQLNFILLQKFIDNTSVKANAMMFKQIITKIYDIAIKRGSADKNIGELLEIKAETKKQIKKRCLTREEIKEVEKNANKNNLVDMLLLICLYSGMRINEACKIPQTKILYNEDIPYIVAGSKTSSGKNRIIPIHPKILDTIKKISSLDNIKKWAIIEKTHLERDYTTHCCRITFITKMQSLEVTPSKLKKIVGHKTADITDNVYTKYSVKTLYDEIIKLNY